MKVREPQWLLSGGSVPKMELGNQISNIIQTRPNFWGEYNPYVIENWRNLAKNKNITLDEMNDFILSHLNLVSDYKEPGKAIKGSGVKSYQENYHNKYKFGNTSTFWNGFKREGTDPTGQTADYKRNGLFVGDDYVGGQTYRRRTTFFNPEELAQANEAVKSRGWLFVEAQKQYNDDPTRKAYVLDYITLPDLVVTPSGSSMGDNISNDLNTLLQPEQTEGNNLKPNNLNRLTFDKPIEPKKQKLNWSDWIPLTAQLTGDLITNSYISQQQKKMRFPLREAPYLQHKVTNDYYTRSELNLNAGEARRAAGQYLTSDINLNLRIREQAEKQAQEYEKLANELKADTFARESQLAEETRNKNIFAGTETANYNRQQNAAAWNNILNANQLQAAKNLQAINSYIGNMYQSLGEALKTKRLNEQGYQKAYNQYLANQEAQKARNEYTTNSSDITKWDNLEGALEAFLSEGSDINPYRLANSGWQATGAAQMLQGLNDAQKRLFANWLLNSTSEGAQLQRANWQRYQDQLKSNYYDQVQGIQNKLAEQNLNVPSFVDNQWSFDWIKPKQRQTSILWTPKKKDGGIIIARNGSKFSDFTRQYSRELQHVRKSQDERNKTSLKHLDKQLERLNREQLLLLRSVFK